MVTSKPHVESWSPDDVCHWLASLGQAFVMYGAGFRYHGINGKALLQLENPEHFETIGVVADLHQKVIKSGILNLKNHLTKLHRQNDDSTGEEPLATESRSEVMDLSGKDFVQKLNSRCTEDQFSENIVDILSSALPRLTEQAKEKIKMLFQD